jgi:polyhydroxyalkanoate synthesis repressor PhaR
MAGETEPTVIKKYANRRLYNTGTSTYVTLDDLGEMVKAGEDFTVVDAKTGDDITRSVLTQIIFEQESRGPNLLPVNFLRQLIRFYGDSMQSLVPSYLDMSMRSLTNEQEKLREQMTKAFGATTFGALEEQTRRNVAMFEQAFRMFTPFANQQGTPSGSERTGAEDSSEAGSGAAEPARPDASDPTESEIDALKKQLSDMQQRLDSMARKR